MLYEEQDRYSVSSAARGSDEDLWAMAGFPGCLLAEILRLGLVAEVLFAVLGHEPGAADLTGVWQNFGVWIGLNRLAHSATLAFMCRHFFSLLGFGRGHASDRRFLA